jgi:nuclear pore complex protein Nup188
MLHQFHPIIAELVFPLRTLASVASVGLLKPNRCMEYFLDPEKHPASADSSHDSWLSSEVLEQVHNITVAATEAKIDSASPVSLSWAVILHGMNLSYTKRSEKRDNLLLQSARERFEAGNVVRGPPGRRNSAGSIYSIESSRFDTFLENGTPSKDLQASRRICDAATENGYVYNVISGIAFGTRSSPGGCMTPLLSSRIRASLMEAVQAAEPFIGYQDAPVRTVLGILSVDREYWDITQDHILPSDQDVVASTARGAWLQERILQIAIDRNPHELLPFIMLCRSLCSTLSLEDDELDQILGLLRHTPTLAVILPQSAKWVSISDGPDAENGYYRLLNDVPLVPQSSSWTSRKPEEEDFYIPANTLFRFLDQAGTASIVEYNHSTLALLGQRLDVNLSRERELLFELFDAETTAEVISFFATLIHVDCLKAANANPNGSIVHLESDILHEASKHLSGGRDIVTVVCATMDYYLQDELAMSDENAVAVLNSCIQFLHSILPLHPSRVWSYLARCELLSSESKAGKLAKITGTLDLNSSRYDFLRSSVRLFSDLIETAMTSAVQRRVGSKAVGRQRPDANLWLGTSDKVLSRVSYSIAQASVDIFENTSTWRFESPDKQTSLLESVVPILRNLISYCYSMGDMQTSSGLTSTLRPAASYVVDCFVQPSTGTLRFQPMLSSLVEACLSGESTLHISKYQSLYTQVTSVLDFATSLLRVSNLLEVSSNMIETYLFKSCTLLARLSGVSPHLRVPALRLLDALVVNAGKSTSEPPSLLGYLGPQISKSFLQQLSTLGKPFSLAQDVKTTWKFFSSILRNRQQWMSNCLLTGQTPREAMKKGAKKGEMASDSIFGIALKKLSRLNELDSSQALVILDFVASAQNYWPWTVFTLQKDTSYLDGLRDYVRELQPSHVTAKTSVTKAAIDARVAAYIGETLAMQLYHSRHLGNADDLAEKLVADIDYYLRDGVEVAGYNKSLHTNFARNFSNKYAGCSLDEFQRTLLEPRELGVDFYYDLERASTMLGFDPGWLGRKQNGFKTEMERANANLSLVDAQIVSQLPPTLSGDVANVASRRCSTHGSSCF